MQLNLRPVEPETVVIPSRPRRERAQQLRPPVRPRRAWYLPLKYGSDFVLALLLTVVALPVVALAALAVKLTSRGPAFYTQTRIGRGGRTFTIYKIRSMIHNCESLTGPRWSMPGDPRVTPVGWFLRATHLDELPQLLNVLRGEMSLIGPRPERPEFVPKLEREVPGYKQRLLVRPGVTGLAQVQLPPDTDVDSVRRKLAHDLYYIAHISPWLDLRLLLCTAFYAFGVPFRVLSRLLGVPASAGYRRDDGRPGRAGAAPARVGVAMSENAGQAASLPIQSGKLATCSTNQDGREPGNAGSKVHRSNQPDSVHLRHRSGSQRGGISPPYPRPTSLPGLSGRPLRGPRRRRRLDRRHTCHRWRTDARSRQPACCSTTRGAGREQAAAVRRRRRRRARRSHRPDRRSLRAGQWRRGYLAAKWPSAFEARSGADCLGRPQPLDVRSGAEPLQRAIAAARGSRLGHHPASFIYAATEGFVPPQSGAVAYRREVFATVGTFDEAFDACEDVEFNHRVAKAGLTCFFTPRASPYRYYPRSSLAGLFRQMVRFMDAAGFGCCAKHPETFTLPGFVPAAFLLGVAIGPLLALASPLLGWVYAGVIRLYAPDGAARSAPTSVCARRQVSTCSIQRLVFVTVHAGAGWGILRPTG